jgi:uncharacterized protein
MIIEVKVKTRARGNKMERLSLDKGNANNESDNTFMIRTTKSAIDGQANEAVIKIVADFFCVSKSAVFIKSGFASKIKIVEIDKD